MKIVSCNLGRMPQSLFDPMPVIHVVFEDGSEKDLFQYYPDEISFSESEIIGLTEQEVWLLRHKKDVAYLRS
jgi:hypothetical protein